MKGHKILVFWENDQDNDEEYNIIYESSRKDITAVAELLAVERLHENIFQDQTGNLLNPDWPAYEPKDYIRAYRVEHLEHLETIAGMFNLLIESL